MTTLSTNGVRHADLDQGVATQVQLGDYRRPDHSGVKVLDVVDGQLRDWAWQMYEGAFRKLNTNTVQRHLKFRHEFDEVMTDPRWGKYLAVNTDGDIIGLSTYTNDLDAIPEISQPYFAKHHPDHYAAKKLWWIGFVAVAQEARGMVTFRELIKTMFAAHGPDATTGIDYAKVNIELGLAKAAVRYLQRLEQMQGHTVECEMVDYQGYFLYTYPPAEETPA
jgi:hypothetical protein